jgi:aspartyl-tRNA(Asn)/glutamyl-tRNA(Gln) amidotransferase subunit B
LTWEAVIGLETHVQLATASKLFSGASTAYGAPPNTQACGYDVALPGELPVPNVRAVELAVRLGLAIGAQVARESVFARKNYFYPDLPKGYQISQYEHPIVAHGGLDIETADGLRRIRILRAHLEEDAGKSLHEGSGEDSGIDLNRAGVPLLEIVTEPDLRSPAEAVAYLKALHRLVRWLGVSDGNMQEGSFRCDANVSVRRAGEMRLGTRTETKNLNSFRFLERAIVHEIARQIGVLEAGGRVVQETRLYDPERDETRPMRSKEEAHDYRYFPDPDLPPLVLDEAFIARERDALPELPWVREARFVSTLGVTAADAQALTASRALADYFEAALGAGPGDARLAVNWLTGEVQAALNRDGLEIGAAPVSAAALGGLLARIADGTLSGKLAKEVFAAMWAGGGDADAVIAARGLKQISDTGALEGAVRAVIEAHPEQVAQVRAGKDKVLGFLVGQVMKATQGKANPAQVNALLRTALGL